MRILRLDHHKLRPWRRYARPFVQVLGGYAPFPLAIAIYITLACDLRCEMCCQTQYGLEHTGQMSFDDFVKVIDNIEKSFRFKPRLQLAGGEPSIHREFMSMMRYAIGRGFSCATTSNGSRIESVAEELVALGVPNVTLSLDGVEEVHNTIRGRSYSYDHVVAAAKALRVARDRAGVDHPLISINTAITRHNYDRLIDMVDLTRDVGGDYLSFQHYIFMDGTPFADHGLLWASATG